MEIRFNATGARRKELVKAIGEALGWEPLYKGAPSFAYVVNNVTVSRDGALSWDERTDEAVMRDLLNKLRERGFSLPQEENDTDTLTIEMPLEGFTEEMIANIEKLIASKATLIKKAVGAKALPVIRRETTLAFPWFSFNATGDEVSAYSRFIGALCVMAKKQKWVAGMEKAVDNEKYAFRVFLLRLGFVGDDYKEARKILLRNLNGNSAFKSGTPARAEDNSDE